MNSGNCWSTNRWALKWGVFLLVCIFKWGMNSLVENEWNRGKTERGATWQYWETTFNLSTAQTIASELPANLANLSQFPAIRDDIHRNVWNIQGEERKENQIAVHFVTAEVWQLPRASVSEDKLIGCSWNNCFRQGNIRGQKKKPNPDLQGTSIFSVCNIS